MLYIKNDSGNTMLLEILQETERGIIPEKLFELCKNLLEYGYRINNHNCKKDFYDFFIFQRLNIKNELKNLCKEYKDNYKEFIAFEV